MLRQALRQQIERLKPSVEKITRHPWVIRYVPALSDPDLWQLNRRSTARAVAVGLLCGLIPGPVQVAGAIALSLLWRANFPLAAITTLYTNPFTIVPLYVLAYQIGRFVTGDPGGFVEPPAFEMTRFVAWTESMQTWMIGVGKPLGIGLVLLAIMLAIAGYFLTKAAWRIWLIRAWRRRGRARRNGNND